MKRVFIALAQVFLLISCNNGNNQNAVKHNTSPIAIRIDNTVAIQISRRNNGYNLVVRNLNHFARIFVNNKSYQVIDTSGVYPLASDRLNPGENKIMLVALSTKGTDTCVSSIFLPYEVNYTILQRYPHNRTNFTQGLFVDNNIVYESTGLEGRSKIVKYHLGKLALKAFDSMQNAPDIFGEGIALYNGSLYQLTWKNHIVYQYDPATLKRESEFAYPIEGWGLCADNNNLIASDGNSFLYFIDPATFSIINRLPITDAGVPVSNINELESVNDLVIANIWQTDRIVFINKHTGNVIAYTNCARLTEENKSQFGDVDFLNGIAYNPQDQTLLITGKLWGWVYKIKLDDRFSKLTGKN